jgi:hypothetical protein
MSKEAQLQLVLESSVLVYVRCETFSPQRSMDSARDARTNFARVVRYQEIIDPKCLGGFVSLRTAAARACRARGTYFPVLGGWLVPQDQEAALLQELEALKTKWDEVELEELRQKYDGWVLEQSRHAKNEQEANAVLALAPPVANVMRATTFAIAVVKITGDNLAANADQTCDSIVDRVFAEFASDIREGRLLESKFYTQGAVGYVRRMQRKAATLHYLHPRLQEVAERADELLQVLPADGRLAGPDAAAIRAFLEPLADPERFLSEGFGAAQAATASPAAAAMVPHRPDRSSARQAPAQGASEVIEDDRVSADEPIVEQQAAWNW